MVSSRKPVRSWRALFQSHRGAWVFSAFLVLLIATILLIPEGVDRPPRVPSLPIFPSEPEVRILLFALEVGQSVGLGPGTVKIQEARSSARQMAAGPVLALDGGCSLGGESIRLPARVASLSEEGLELGNRSYPSVELMADAGRVLVVARVRMEDYLLGVVNAELGGRFHLEALRAQAICARSYAAFHLVRRRNAAYDLGDDQYSQVYRGTESIPEKVRRAVRSTATIGLVFDARVLEGLFSSTCGGTTRPAGEAFGGDTIPPLAGATCGHCKRSPAFAWSVAMKASLVADSVGLGATPTAIDSIERTPSGRLVKIVLRAGDLRAPVPAARLKSLFGPEARSTWFTRIELEAGKIVADGLGFGHGVGLCQYGAEDFASRVGLDGLSILEHYFPGARLMALYPGARG